MDAIHGTGHSAGNSTSAIQNVYARKWSFLVVFALVFLVTFTICATTGFIPDASATGTNAPVATLETSSLVTGPAAGFNQAVNAYDQQSGEVPVHVTIPAINLSVSVSNPNTTDVNTLDNYLLSGAVRYPTSATLGEQGNVILFGHSSYLPIVHNQAYKTFDGIQNLKQGDQIIVYSNDQQYVYSVQTVQQESATSDAIPLTATGHTLTLATCDSFGSKSDRFVVTATLVGSSPRTS